MLLDKRHDSRGADDTSDHSNSKESDRTDMETQMTASDGGGSDDDTDATTRTTIEVNRDVWRQVRSDAVADGKNVSEKLEEVLEDYYDLD